MHKPIRSLVSAAVLAVMANTSAQAAGFSLYNESSGAAVGNFGAGISAEAADATTGWFNPAGLALIKDEQAIAGGVAVLPTSKLSGTTTYTTKRPNGAILNLPQNVRNPDGGENALVPSLHYAHPLGENAAFGVSVVAPFGLATEWGKHSAMRYSATRTELITVNVSPQIGGKLTKNLAVGAGLDVQYSDVTFNRVLGAPNTAKGTGSPATYYDSESYNEAHSVGVGFHAGILALFNNNHTRIGINYQSRMKHKYHGFSRLTGRLADPAGMDKNAVFQANRLFSNNAELPRLITLSAYHDLNQKLAVLGSVVYTGWGVFKKIELNNAVAGFPMRPPFLAKSTAEQNYNDAWRFALGANYQLNEKIMLRCGAGYDETPTNDQDRDIRLPDASRYAFALGGHYDYNQKLAFDLGYTYIFAPHHTSVNKTEVAGPFQTNTVNVTGKPYAHLIGVQGTWYIDGRVQQVTK